MNENLPTWYWGSESIFFGVPKQHTIDEYTDIVIDLCMTFALFLASFRIKSVFNTFVVMRDGSQKQLIDDPSNLIFRSVFLIALLHLHYVLGMLFKFEFCVFLKLPILFCFDLCFIEILIRPPSLAIARSDIVLSPEIADEHPKSLETVKALRQRKSAVLNPQTTNLPKKRKH
eukprot:GDKJ01000281.1.p1 GENE.GDKJ01000281.1~~GDKJ01000281.1.p1  ORF type:complete len:173 (+),score=17.19 GDKJ01000281.1:74-592(+)